MLLKKLFATGLLCILFISAGAAVFAEEGIPKSSNSGGSVTSAADKDDSAPVSPAIIRQPENRYYIPGSSVTLSLRAQGKDLQYQWYYKKPGQTSFTAWNSRIHTSESVTPGDSWNGIELYCRVTDGDGHSVNSDTVTICRSEEKLQTVLAVGDSLCKGTRNGGKGFVGDLGIPYLNAAVPGASLSTARSDVTNIPDQLAQVTGFDPDIVIAQGGLNDLYADTPMGDIPTRQATDIDSLDLTTIMGGMQKLFIIMKDRFPDAQHFFLINHKVFRKGVYLVTTPNGAGYTQQDMHDAFVACCKVYNVGVMDVFQDSPLDSGISSFLCEENYTWESDPGLDRAQNNQTDYINGNGVHPLSRGYIEYYLPVILNHITVEQPPEKQLSILSQPQDQSILLGEKITLSVKAEGDFVKYKWYFRKKSQTDFTPWPNRVSATETVTPSASWDGIQLYCAVTDSHGTSMRSDIVTVKVRQELKIITQPQDRLFAVGSMTAFSLKAQGTGLRYQWYFKKRGQTTFTAWNNRTHPAETVSPDASWDGIELYCVVTDREGFSVQSDTVTACIGDAKKILAVGDSICKGNRNSSRGFVGDLGLPYRIAALTGATLSANDSDIKDIPSLLAEIVDYDPDIVIADGGVNDYLYSVPMGEIPSSPLKSESELDSSALGTVMGGLQRLFLIMENQYPDAQKYFVITHKTTRRIPKTINGQNVYTDQDKYVDFTVTQNGAGYTQQDLHDAIAQCCAVYGVEVIDVYNDSPLNTALSEYRSPTAYSKDNSVTYTQYVDIDGVHPLSLGYTEYYLPVMLQHIDTATSPKTLAITRQPESQTTVPGGSVTLSLKAQGDFLKYQWYFKKEGQTDFSPWTNRVKPSETVTPPESWDGIQLYCVVTDKYGHSAQSDTVTIAVRQEPAITRQPESREIHLGDSVTLSLAAKGNSLKYQWYYKKPGQSQFAVWKSHTRASETVTPPESWDGIQLYCIVTDRYGVSVQSKTVRILVRQKPAIIRQPQNMEISFGESVTLSLEAQGNALKYQWYFKKEGKTDFSPWTNRVKPSETVTPPESWDGIHLYCVVTDRYGVSVQSKTVRVLVRQEPSITRQPENRDIFLGDAVTLSLRAKGNSLKYQWYYKKAGQTQFAIWKSHTKVSETVTPPESWDGIQLYCIVTDRYGVSVQSKTVRVLVRQKPAIIRQPQSMEISLGESVTLSLKAQGNDLQYQWYYKKSGQAQFAVWKNRTHASETVTPPESWDGIQLYCIVTDRYGVSVQSESAIIQITKK